MSNTSDRARPESTMSAFEQDQLVTKASVILRKPDDWELWLAVKRDIALRHRI